MIDKIRNCKSMEELDKLRAEVFEYSTQSPGSFKETQKEFIKKKDQLKNIPLLREKIVWKGEYK